MTAALDGRSPTILTRIGAERLTARIRAQLTSTLELLATAREGRAWEAMGYPDWHSYCEGEYGDLRELRLPRTERLALVASMRTASSPLSTRAIRERLGVSASSVQDDLAQLRAAGELAGERVVGRDGVERPARRLQAVQEPEVVYPSATARALALVAAQGERGLTVRELCLETGWHHGQASGALSRLARRQQAAPGELRRLGCAAYVAL